MLEWLLAPIDPSRPHDLDLAAAWHGRFMVAAWAFLLPVGIVAARFLKIAPGQDWPRRLDHHLWWHTHLVLQYTGALLTAVALAFALTSDDYGAFWHRILGYAVIGLCAGQILAAWVRGSKGGPTEPHLEGDHYDMTLRRRLFEYWHKFAGYVAIAAAGGAMVTGLWLTNAYAWMFVGLVLWWSLLSVVFVVLQRRGMAIDTYQAIWGPDPAHPGNQVAPIGWGVRRPMDLAPAERHAKAVSGKKAAEP